MFKIKDTASNIFINLVSRNSIFKFDVFDHFVGLALKGLPAC